MKIFFAFTFYLLGTISLFSQKILPGGYYLPSNIDVEFKLPNQELSHGFFRPTGIWSEDKYGRMVPDSIFGHKISGLTVFTNNSNTGSGYRIERIIYELKQPFIETKDGIRYTSCRKCPDNPRPLYEYIEPLYNINYQSFSREQYFIATTLDFCRKVILNQNGERILNNEFDEINPLWDGSSILSYSIEGKWGTIKLNESLVAVGAGLNFLQADSIGIRNKRPVFWKNRFYGLIDQDGKPNTQAIFEEKKVISRIVPAKLSESNGPYILLLSKEKKMSLVCDNKIIIEPLYDSIGYSANQSNLRYYENNYQNEFRTALLNQKNEAEKKIFTPIMVFSDKASGFNIRIPVWKSGKQGYVDESGKVIIPPVFDRIDYFDDKAEIPNYSISDEGQTYSLGMKVAFIKSGEKWGLVNKESGKVLLSPKYDMIKSIHVPDVARYRYYRDPFSIKLENKYGLIDDNGNELVSPIYDSPLEFMPEDESILLKKNGFYGLYLRGSGITHPVKYQKILSTTDIAYDVKINNKWGRIDYDKTLIPAIYDSQITFNSEGIAKVSINGHYSKIDYKGNPVEDKKTVGSISNDYSSSIDKFSNVNSDYNPSSSNLSNECKSNLQILFNSSKRALEIIKKREGYYFDIDAYGEEVKKGIDSEKKIKSCPKFNSTETEIWNKILSYNKERRMLFDEWELLWKQKKIVDTNNQLSYGNQWQCGICGFESKLAKKPLDGAYGGCRSSSFHSWREANSNRGYQCSICGFKSYISTSSGPKKPLDGAYGGCRSSSFHSWKYFGN
jgi:hypothetical protein